MSATWRRNARVHSIGNRAFSHPQATSGHAFQPSFPLPCIGWISTPYTGEPVVGLFGLPAVADALPENAVVVTQAIAHAGNAEGRHRIEKTRRQPAQAAVAEAGVWLLLDDLEWIKLVMFGELLRVRVKPKIADIVGQSAAEQKFHREVVNALGVTLPARLF